MDAQIPPLSPLMLAQGATVTTSNGLLRRNSAGSFSKLSDFWLDGTPSGPGTPLEKPTQNVNNIGLSIDAS